MNNIFKNATANLKAVAAMSSNRVIGNNGELPWHFSEDLKFFKKLTLNSTVVMGRKTFDSIGKPLPKRKNIVISRSMEKRDDVLVYQNIETFLTEHSNSNESIFIIGGAQIYSALMNWTKEIYLTFIFGEYSGDAYFPKFENHYELKEIIFKNNDLEVRRYALEEKS